MQQALPDRSILRAFYVQYAAVLLIVLSCMVGSFARKSFKHEAERVEHTPPAPIGDIEIAYPENGSERAIIKDPALQAVASVLTSHDLDATITIPTREIDDQIDYGIALDEALTISEAMSKFFEAQGVPAAALRILVQSSEQAHPIKVVFSRTRSP